MLEPQELYNHNMEHLSVWDIQGVGLTSKGMTDILCFQCGIANKGMTDIVRFQCGINQ